MRAKTILACTLFLALGIASQDVPKPQRQAQCKFSDGKAITVTYSSESKTYRLVTNGNPVTVQDVNVPAGDYTVLLAWDRRDKYNLRMRETKKGHGQMHQTRLGRSSSFSIVSAGLNMGTTFKKHGPGLTRQSVAFSILRFFRNFDSANRELYL